jgi:hypothetical protein
LNPPMAEAQIWQWPINTLNPTNTNMDPIAGPR